MQGESGRHQRQLQCHAQGRSPKLEFWKPVFQKQEKPKHLKQRQDSVQRIESVTKRTHEEHIAGEGQNSVSHYKLVHKLIPMLQAMKIPHAKAAVDKEWKKA